MNTWLVWRDFWRQVKEDPSEELLTFLWTVTDWKYIHQFSSVTQSCPTLCNPMDCSMPGFPVHHQLPELAQTRVHRVSDTIQPSHPLSTPSAFSLSSIRVFSNESVFCIKWPKYWSFSFSNRPSGEYSGLISFRTDWLDLATGLSRVFSSIILSTQPSLSSQISI